MTEQRSDTVCISHVRLQTPDLGRALAFYTEVLGLVRLGVDPGGDVALGVQGDSTPQVVLHENRDAQVSRSAVPGLYHFALLLPSRAQLGLAIGNLGDAGWPLQGASDHLVSEAVYLSDADGNGIEIYRDWPREEWTWQGSQVVMTLDPFDFQGVLGDAARSAESWTGMPSGTRIGHIHLQVSDTGRSRGHYEQIVGMDVTNQLIPGAAFLSVAGYHHHLGLNSWNTVGARRPDTAIAGLLDWAITFGDDTRSRDMSSRAEAAGVLSHSSDDDAIVDPDGLRLVIR